MWCKHWLRGLLAGLQLKLLQTYISYGSDFSPNTFRNSYWYKTIKIVPFVFTVRDYYRWITVYNEGLQSTNIYRLRSEGDELFQTRISVMRFSSWLVVNMYWFQPDKKKKKREARIRPYNYTNAASNPGRSYSSIVKFRTFVSYARSQTGKSAPTYLF